MTVIQTSAGQIKPGRHADFLAQAGEFSKLFQRLGAPPPRLFLAGLAGEAYGTWTFSVECEDLDAFGALSDELNRDAEAQAMLLRLQDANAPTIMTNVQLLTEVPGREGQHGQGPVLAVWVSKTHPGGLQRSLEQGHRANAFAEKHGAVRTRMFSTIGAGSGTGMYIAAWEFADMRGYARVIESFGTEPEGQAIATEAAAADAPNTLVFEGVYTELPI